MVSTIATTTTTTPATNDSTATTTATTSNIATTTNNHNIDQKTNNDINRTTTKKLANGNLLRAEKRRKFEAKQARLQHDEMKHQERIKWIQQNSQYARLVTTADIDSIQNESSNSNNNQFHNLLYPYMNLQDGDQNLIMNKNSNDINNERLFIAEGTETIRLLVNQATIQSDDNEDNDAIVIKSIFVKPSVFFDKPVHLLQDYELFLSKYQQHKEQQQSSSKDNRRHHSNGIFQLFIDNDDSMSRLAGFPISRGALACGIVPTNRDENWLKRHLAKRLSVKSSLRILALDGICDTSNLGSMTRCASAFAVDAIILSSDCCDAWYRRAVRVSMGHIFRVPVVRVVDLAATLLDLKKQPYNLVSFAAVVDHHADRILDNIERGAVPKSWCCVMGNESKGISNRVVNACHVTIKIDMDDSVDSLSVPIATGILLHGLKEKEKR